MDKATEVMLGKWIESIGASIASLVRITDTLVGRVDGELAELRDGLVDQDHRLAATRQEVAALDDALSVLRNDYRGEAA